MTPPAIDTVEHRPRGLPSRTAIAAIRLYQLVRAGRPSPCRYWPTCSEYGREAYSLHGFWHGTGLTARRLLRCRPGAARGWDPVPPPGEHARREWRAAAEGGTEYFVAAEGGTEYFVAAEGGTLQLSVSKSSPGGPN